MKYKRHPMLKAYDDILKPKINLFHVFEWIVVLGAASVVFVVLIIELMDICR